MAETLRIAKLKKLISKKCDSMRRSTPNVVIKRSNNNKH